MIKRIVLIGAGNLATNLGSQLKDVGCQILQVYSRTLESANALAQILNCESTNDLKQINQDADLYIFSVSDNAINNILNNLNLKDKFCVHTAGSLNAEIFLNFTSKFGVFYPLQTFSKQKKVNFSTIPICIESNNSDLELSLINLARAISKDVRLINSEQRAALHLAAVFACNFTNHMYNIAYSLLNEKNIDFNILRPLICETNEKIKYLLPSEAQTGPAVRYDENILNDHKEKLKNHVEFEKIYDLISQNIYKLNKK